MRADLERPGPVALPSAVLAPPPGAVALTVAGETLWLLPQRALYWPEQGLLMVADVHLGKAASFRELGVPVPGGTGSRTLEQLDAALASVPVARLIVLGDLLHARSGRTAALDGLVRDWLARHPALSWELLVGNHDRRAGVPAGWRLGSVEEGARIGPFALHHAPQHAVSQRNAAPRAAPPLDSAAYVLCGHIHPAVRLRGRAGDRARLPCFWFGARCGVLPAFGAFTGHHDVRPQSGDRLGVIAEGTVVLFDGPGMQHPGR